jgi:UPF0716 protein FxsA
MRILLFPLLLLIGLPVFEIYLFIEVGTRIGYLQAVGLLIAGMAVGALIIRYQGFLTLMRVRDAMLRGEAPTMALLEGLLLLVSGFLFVLPGFFTDALGLLLLVPFLRRLLIRNWLGRFRAAHPGARTHREHGGRTTIDGEFHREDDPRIRSEGRGPRSED